jgi:hypothetical protein
MWGYMYGITFKLTEFFNQISSLELRNSPEVDYAERDIIEIAVDDLIIKDDTPELEDDRVINFQYIIDTGEVSQGLFPGTNYDIDWESDDLFNQRIDEIEKCVLERVSQHDDLQGLINKTEWTTEDRLSWEFHLSEIVSEEVNKVAGFEEYRRSGATKIEALFSDVDRESHANEISRDLENGTQNIEFDCELMTLVEGTILQRVENGLLPESSETEGDYKKLGNYFYAQSQVAYNPHEDDRSEWRGHAYIISSVTGNIIEATADPDDGKHPYTFNMDPNFSFEEFVETGLAITTGGIYHTESIDLKDALDAQLELVVYDQDKVDFLYEYIQDRYAGSDPESAACIKDSHQMNMLVLSANMDLESYENDVEGFESYLAELESSSRLSFNDHMRNNPAEFSNLHSEEDIKAFIDEKIEEILQSHRDEFKQDMPDKETYLREQFSNVIKELYNNGSGTIVENILSQIAVNGEEKDISINSIVSMGNTNNEVGNEQVALLPQTKVAMDMV